MSIVDELKALGASDDYCVYVERLTSQDFTLVELVLPLVLQLGHTRVVRKRMEDKLRAQVRELDAKDRRITNLTKEKLGWEATNHKRNEYIEELKKARRGAEQETARVKRVYNELKLVTFGTRYGVDGKEFVARCTPGPELQAAYYAPRPMVLGCKVPEPEQPYVRYQDKKSWAIGDRVRITEGLAGTVRHISYGERLGAHTVGILTDTKGDVQTTHWLIRKSSLHSIEYRGQYTTQVQK